MGGHPDCDEESLSLLGDVFGFHAVTIWECRQRQRMAKFHPNPDHVFVVLHSPELGDHGHVHYVELDQFLGPNYLVAIHGPTNPAVPSDVPLRDTSLLWDRICEGRLLPRSATQVSHAVVTSVARGMEEPSRSSPRTSGASNRK